VAGVRFYHPLALILLLWAGATRAKDTQNPPQLYDRPVLAVDPATHTAAIYSASVDRDGRWAVTGSLDKTVRIWSLADGKLERTIRLPAGPGNIGKVYSVTMSPDGALIAVGGWMRSTVSDHQEQIYLFDRVTGTLVRRIEGLPDAVRSLAFSLDGSRLAAGLLSRGLRVYTRDLDWDEIARDEDYGGPVYGLDFAPDGRLATSSLDGRVRLYAPKSAGPAYPSFTVKAPSGSQPLDVKFSPADGERLAVGHAETPAVDVLDGRTLAALPGPRTSGVEARDLGKVAWSRDGATLMACGRSPPLVAWSQAGAGPPRLLAEIENTVLSLVSLPNDDLLLAGGLGLRRLGSDGTQRWSQKARIADFWMQADRLSVSPDGSCVGFGYESAGASPARFNMVTRTITLGPGADPQMTDPRQTGLNVDAWVDNYFPTLDGKRLSLSPYEVSRSLAIHPTGRSFVLGTSWNLRAYDAQGAPLWSRPAPGEVRAVNISDDGRLVVAAYDDGTIRWHRVTDGAELVAFMPLADPDRKNWVAWTPEGFYAASAGAQGVLRWHVNNGWEPADSVAVEDIPGSYRPEVLPLVLQELETPRALGLADLAEHNREVMLRTHSHISPGAKLHLLTIGIDQYNEE
jgi:WD40 repeat protein